MQKDKKYKLKQKYILGRLNMNHFDPFKGKKMMDDLNKILKENESNEYYTLHRKRSINMKGQALIKSSFASIDEENSNQSVNTNG